MERLDGEDWKSVAGWLLAEDLDAGVNRVLGLLGRRHAADRVWVIRYDESFTFLWNTHEWVAPGITPQMGELQGLPVEAGQWMHEGLHQDGRLLIEDIGKMPRRARGLQAELQRQGIRSLLSLPVFREGRLAFQIGYDAVHARRDWPEVVFTELGDAVSLIANALWHRGPQGVAAFPAGDRESRLIHLKDGGSLVPVSEILWIEASGDYTIIHSRGKLRQTERRSVKEWESILPRKDFLRIHRGAIVQVSAIQRLDRSGGKWRLMLLPDGPQLPVGRAYHAAVRRRLGF
ncbi:GAF domain-containing DNA-binding protein [Luteolibacter flavescens]|uniref:GAF domain-containing DNA-binding protein n=1 Tax=Luteolibacter flavescens TaxID=1859460 RepID=A0ABT3FM68_9BACT|nr:GAF domain-containing DNA-binding protein [Luteolibacter flavescens]MCW1884065.1 GAF domain-containing DNA-binding protein [Luteolibacter flavescens]